MSSRIIILAIALVAGGQAAAQAFAWIYSHDPSLGPALRPAEGLAFYPPWALLEWRARFSDANPGLSAAAPAFLLVFGLTLAAGLVMTARRSQRRRGWGSLVEAKAAGLRDGGGCILGVLEGRLLATLDLRPTLVTGGTRSGKGRGHVAPTLLSWPASALVHDPKGELWTLTAGWRAGFSHAMRFAPRDPRSVRFNPLAEIRPGPREVAEVQRLVSILSDPSGVRDDDAIWDRAASEILEATILHVLYTAPDADKTLLTVRDLIADLDATADVMGRTLHRPGPDGSPQTHPFIATAVKGYATMHDRFRTSVQGTARSYLKWLAGEDVERALSASDLALGDLMCARAPVSLYVQVSPADAAALRPLVRLLFYAAAQTLTTDEHADAAGRPKIWRLLMLMDEFPMLGRLAFFEKALRLMSGYGIKTMFVAQSLNDIVETYGAHNTILDNCHVYTAFSALDPLTQEKVSRLAGSTLEARESRSRPAGLSRGHASISRSETERPLLEPGEVRALPDDVQLVFAAGSRPFRTRKLKYDRRAPFARRARIPPPSAGLPVDSPGRSPHPWSGRRALGEVIAPVPLADAKAAFDEVHGVVSADEYYERLAREFIAQEAARENLEGGRL